MSHRIKYSIHNFLLAYEQLVQVALERVR